MYLQWFSDWRMYVSTISSGTSGIFNFFKHMSLKYFFQTILGVVQYKSYNLKSPPYAPVVYVQNIEMCMHSSDANQINFMLRFKMGTVSDLSLKSLDIQRPGGIMCDHLLSIKISQRQ